MDRVLRTFICKSTLVLFIWLINTNCAAIAHVKWFLSRPESEILKQAKPPLFTHLSIDNLLPILLAIGLMLVVLVLNTKWNRWSVNERLLVWAQIHEPVINLYMAIMLGVSLIYCGISRTLLVPNFIICSHCPQWLPGAEIAVGIMITVGLFSRLCALSILYLMLVALCKHGLDDCLDLLPFFGSTIYFLCAGRNRFSLDYVLAFDRKAILPSLTELAHLFIRWSMGLGLIILALNEKLLYPQLAMDILQHAPSLNFMHNFGISNAMFILLSGLTELLLGFCVLTGSFPRLAVIIMLTAFAGTTVVFGPAELFGHASCYGIILSIFLRGTGITNKRALLCQMHKDLISWLNVYKIPRLSFAFRTSWFTNAHF